jgi:prepilin-type N-terminal cleavage/methylation domain-containing protein
VLHEGMMARAFSLIELIVVLVIMATLAGVAVPRYAAGAARYRAEAAARRVCAEIARAQALACTRSSAVAVAFDPDTDTCVLLEPIAGTTIDTIHLQDAPYGADLVATTIASRRIVFNGYGLPDGGGEVSVRVGSAQRAAVVDAASGEASVP